jgi:Bifunctional DNA primase/polymerase, N-terminal/Family of unknown function (DUF5906)/Primase C terminal 1 (PriCT-1)
MSAAPEIMTTMQAALQLAEEHNLSVFPCKPDKKPYTEHGFQDATRNFQQIEEWWTRWPDALIGVPTGPGLIVVDIDPEGLEWYRTNAERLAAGRVHRTRRGGFHLLYRAPEIEIRNSASKVAPGVDIRGEGGYVVWWPAHGCEVVGSLEDMTEWPEWLLEQIAQPEKNSDRNSFATDATGKATEGQRNDRLSREAFRLRKLGMEPPQILDMLRTLNGLICEPPLADRELEAIANGKKRVLPAAVTEHDFFAYLPAHQYIYVPTRELWPASSVNASVIMQTGKANEWLDEQRAVQQMTWAPGLPRIVENRLVADGGWIEREGVRTFNLYRPPLELDGDPAKAGPWLDHGHKLYPAEMDHLIRWAAHRVQRPGEKINHAILLGGAQGIGKDTILEPVKHAVGPWNFAEVSPSQLLGRFNSFVKSVVLRMSEARDLGDVDRYGLYEHLKTLTAAPPDVLRCDEKHLREHAVFNVTGVVVTTNHVDGIYLPADDRRHFVAWSELTKEDFAPDYWQTIHGWYRNGGIGHVVAYLRTLDLSDFDPKAPPPKTAAFWRVVDAGRAPEDAELADVLDSLGKPAAVTVAALCIYASDPFREWLQDRRNARQLPHRLEDAGYTAVRNDGAQSGLWVISGKRQVIYARRELAIRDRIVAATALCREGRA